jgi:hypothetical protein
MLIQVGTKSVQECVQFYYIWKKVSSEHYKQLSALRRRREQDELYRLRSTSLGSGPQPTDATRRSTAGAPWDARERRESRKPRRAVSLSVVAFHRIIADLVC